MTMFIDCAVLRRLTVAAALITIGQLNAQAAAADAVADFYAGRTVTIVVGFGPGGGYDLYARLVAEQLGRHIPGRPTVIVKNMPGSASVKAANYVFNATSKDGVVIGSFLNNIVLNKLLRGQAKYEPERFNWLGRVSESSTFLVVWHTVPVRSVSDAKMNEIVIAATGATGHSAIVPWALNRLIGTKFKVVPGYKSSSTAALAVETGEADGLGATSLDYLTAQKQDWLAEKKIAFLYVNDLKRHPKAPEVPTIGELTENADDRKVLRLLGSAAALGRSYAAAPGIPLDRAKALRAAFGAMVADPTFLSSATKRNMDISPLSGEEVEEIVREAASSPATLIERTKELIRPPS